MDDIILYIIVKYGRRIILTEEFMHTFEQTHHLNTTVGDHTLSVAAEAVKLCLMRGYSDEETIRNVVTAALCHDLGIMGRKEKYSNTAQCYLKHPLDSVDVYMGVTGEQEERVMDSIRNHMFPVKPGMPRYKEGWILTLADKISSFRKKWGNRLSRSRSEGRSWIASKSPMQMNSVTVSSNCFRIFPAWKVKGSY